MSIGFINSQQLKFLIVSVVGYLVDISISTMLIYSLSVHAVVAMLVSFTVAFFFNFFAHSAWTFAGTRQDRALVRIWKMAGASALTIAMRLVIVLVLQPYASSDAENAGIVVLAAGVSLVLNFIILKFLVFTASK